MQMLKLLIKSSQKLFTLAVISSLLTGLCNMMVLRQIHLAIQQDTIDLTSFGVQFGVYWIGYGVFAIISTYSVTVLTQSIVHKLRVEISQKILKAEFSKIERTQDRLIPILTEDIRTVGLVIDRMPSVATGFATVVGILIYMIWYYPILSVATVILFTAVIFITKVSLPMVRKYQEKAREKWNEVFDYLNGLVFGIKELTLNEQLKDAYINELIIPSSKEQNSYNVKENMVSSIASKSGDMVLLLGIAAMIVIIFNTDYVSIVEFGYFLTLVLITLAPLSTVAGWFSNLKRIEVALDQIRVVGLELDEFIMSKGAKKLNPASDGFPIIELKDVVHSYYHSDEDAHFEMGPINLQIQKGELIFLLGGNGSGKTTLAKIILGLYNPKAGSISYSGQELNGANLEDFRNKFGATFVDSYLFDQLLHIDEKRLEMKGPGLIETLELSKKVKIQNKKFSTKRLSEGQKKRLGLLISLLEDKEIYLFDEWAANQDPHYKKIFYEQILQTLKSQGKTIIVISHDEQYFDQGDRVIKLMDGQLV